MKIIIYILACLVFVGILFSASKIFQNDENMGVINSVKYDNGEDEEMSILELTGSNFNEEVINSEKTVLLDFYADWCGPCKMMAPIVEKIAEENSNIKVGKINIDNEESLAIEYGVTSIPTFVVIKGGKEVDRIVGAVDKVWLEELLK